MALKVRENVQAPTLGPGQQDDNMQPFMGGTRMGAGQTDPSSVSSGVGKTASSGQSTAGSRKSGRMN